MGVSFLLHAMPVVGNALGIIEFGGSGMANRIFEDTPLEVILVNARSDEVPEQPQAIAQHNLSGGGELDTPGVRAASPLPPGPYDQMGNQLTPVPGNMQGDLGDWTHEGGDGVASFQQLQDMQREQMELLAQVKQQVADLAAAAPQKPASSAEARAMQERRQLLLSIVGEIERRIQYENSRPRRRYIGPSTIKGPQALYYDNLKQKIEEKGTSNFPEHNGFKLYGELILRLVVNHDGRVIETQVMQTSGNRLLDRRAEAIAVTAGPFGTFDTELRRFTDQLVVISRFKFAHNNTLETENSSYQEALDKEPAAPAS
ncbi:MAG: energy transducer TonB [Brachymonas sp.]|nr:energy transducer TonB [Brachymonas sp.]